MASTRELAFADLRMLNFYRLCWVLLMKRKAITLSLIVFIICFSLLILKDYREKSHIYSLQVNLSQSLTELLAHDDSLLPLNEVGEGDWDYICLIGDYSSGEKVVNRSLKLSLDKVFLADYHSGDASNGIVFLSLSRNILITVPVDFFIDQSDRAATCLPATEAYLKDSGKIADQKKLMVFGEK